MVVSGLVLLVNASGTRSGHPHRAIFHRKTSINNGGETGGLKHAPHARARHTRAPHTHAPPCRGTPSSSGQVTPHTRAPPIRSTTISAHSRTGTLFRGTSLHAIGRTFRPTFHRSWMCTAAECRAECRADRRGCFRTRRPHAPDAAAAGPATVRRCAAARPHRHDTNEIKKKNKLANLPKVRFPPLVSRRSALNFEV